jgi:hypothetical protein
MDPIDAILFAVVFSITGTLAVTFGIGWFRASRRIGHLERQLSGAAPETTIAQLENNLAALAEQVEQLANGQDFLSRLVRERPLPKATTPR